MLIVRFFLILVLIIICAGCASTGAAKTDAEADGATNTNPGKGEEAILLQDGRSDHDSRSELGFGAPREGIASMSINKASISTSASIGAVIEVPAMDPNADAGPMIRQKVQEAIAAGPNTELLLGNQTYSVWPPSGSYSCIKIAGAKGLRLRGQASTKLLVRDPKAECIQVSRSTETIVQDFAIDYDPLPFTQGTIRAVDAIGKTFDLEIDEGFPILEESHFRTADPNFRFGALVDRDLRRIKADSNDAIFYDVWTSIGARTYRVHSKSWLSNMAVGDGMYLLARLIAPNGVTFVESAGCSLSSVTVCAAPACAMGIVRCRDIRIDGFRVRFADERRLVTTNADGIHCQNQRGDLLIENCYMEGMADDGANIYTYANKPLAVHSPNSITVSANTPILVGDRLQVHVPKTGAVRSIITVKRTDPDSGGTRIEYVPDLDIALTDRIYNLSSTGEGYVIRNNTILRNRARGLLLRSRGIASGNVLDQCSQAGFMIMNEPNWDAGPVPYGVTLQNNTIIGCGYTNQFSTPAAVQIFASKAPYYPADVKGLRDIRLINNRIIDSYRDGIYIGSAQGVDLTSNSISVRADIVWPNASGITVERSGGVRIQGLHITDLRPVSRAGIWIRSSVDPGSNGFDCIGYSALLTPGVPAIRNDRPVGVAQSRVYE